MKELKKDLFSSIFDKNADAICITTNGHYTSTGVAVMGGGCAKEAAHRWPEIPKRLGRLLKQFNINIPFVIGAIGANGEHLELSEDLIKNRKFKCLIFSFPTINNLINGSNINLIKQSATILVDYANQYNLKNIISVRPGSGIGGLNYYRDVRPEISKIFDDRFTIVCQENDEFKEDL